VNVLVTGGAGYVGSVCVKQLLTVGHKVAVIDDLSTGHRQAVPRGALFVQADLADTKTIGQVVRDTGVAAVMHFAAATLVEKSMTDPRYYLETNVQKALQFLFLLLEFKVNDFIFSSTAAVYGEPVSTPITEDHPLRPINAYGESKLMFEKTLHWYRRAYGLRYVALRYFNAAGADGELGEDHRPETHLIPRLLDATMDPASEFAIYGDDYPTADGTCIRDYVHVLDIAQAHLLALDALPVVKGAVYNVGHSEGHSIREVIDAVAEVTGRRIPVRRGPRRAGDPAVLVASSEKIRRELRWRPRHSDLKNIVRSAWEWKQRHATGYDRPALQ
jgi:UDP-glucose 4-epimerase